jgi:hypothetical protein
MVPNLIQIIFISIIKSSEVISILVSEFVYIFQYYYETRSKSKFLLWDMFFLLRFFNKIFQDNVLICELILNVYTKFYLIY